MRRQQPDKALQASLVSQPSLILQFAGQIYPSWWTTFRGLLQKGSDFEMGERYSTVRPVSTRFYLTAPYQTFC